MSEANATDNNPDASTIDTNAPPISNYNTINIRLSQHILFLLILTLALMSIGLGLNFIFTRPTFNPYGFPKEVTGCVFLTLGIMKIVFLLIRRSLRGVRFTMSIEIGWMIFWGVGTSITYFQGRTSLQLFCLYFSLAAIECCLLAEPFLNPEKENAGFSQ